MILIVPIPSVLAKPFVDQYCDDFGTSKENSPNYGLDVLWYGAISHGQIQAVIGYVALPEGVYVHSYHHMKTFAGKRSFLALNTFTYNLKMPLWGYIRNDNPSMFYRMLKEGWAVVGGTDNETLVNWSCYN